MKVSRGARFQSLRDLEVSVRLGQLLVFVEDDADEIALVLFHVLEQAVFAGGLEAADAAAEQQEAVLRGLLRLRVFVLGV